MHRLLILAFCILQLVSGHSGCFFPNATAINASNLGGSGVHEYAPCNTTGTADNDRGHPWGQMNAPVTGVFLENGRPIITKPNANASTSSSASIAAGTTGPSSTPAQETPARTIVIGVIGGLAGSALVVLGIRLVMIQRNMRAHLAGRDSAALKLPGMIDYVNLGWKPCEAPTYASEYTREELHGEDVEMPQLDGNQRLEKG